MMMMNRGSWLVWTLLCIPHIHSIGAVKIHMYQIHEGPRAIGANITVVSTVSPDPDETSVTIIFETTTKNKTTKAASVFVSDWNNDSSDRLNLMDFPIEYLNISQSVSNGPTRNFEWYFRYLPSHYDGLLLVTKDNADSNKQNRSVLLVEVCMSHNISTKDQDSWIKIESTQEGHYKDLADCNCFKQEETVYTVEGTKADDVANCGYNAQWVGCKNLQCWSAPSDIAAVQVNTTAGTQSPFDCRYTQGFPNVSDEIFKVDNVNIPKNYVLTSRDHGKSLSCQVISDFTQNNGTTSLSSSTSILVHYPPENSTLSSAILVMDLNDSKLFDYSVNANPSEGPVQIIFKNQSDYDVSDIFIVFHRYTKKNNTLHIYEVNFTLTSDQEYGDYNVCASTEIPNGTNCSTLSIRNTVTSTPSLPNTATSSVATGSKNVVGPGLAPPIIGAIVAGAIVMMLIVVGIVIHKKRKQSSSKADNVREETVNVIYDSTQYQASPVENQESVKQEQTNVLYASASGGADGDLVEYATANPDGIASDDAVQYATSNPDAENTGAVAPATPAAELSCSASTSVYAQINKKKGKDNDGYNIEMHDTSEATYTVVDKSKKRTKDDVPEVYAVVNKPRVKG